MVTSILAYPMHLAQFGLKPEKCLPFVKEGIYCYINKIFIHEPYILRRRVLFVWHEKHGLRHIGEFREAVADLLRS